MKKLLAALALLFSLSLPQSAFAVDGCEVLLCIAGNWKKIGQCVPPVKQALKDIAIGKAWPHCAMSSGMPTAAGPSQANKSSADNDTTNEDTCPVMYSIYNVKTAEWKSCKYRGVITVVADGVLWERVFWDTSGDTSTWYSPQAKAELGNQIDLTYDEDLAKCGKCKPPEPKGPQL